MDLCLNIVQKLVSFDGAVVTVFFACSMSTNCWGWNCWLRWGPICRWKGGDCVRLCRLLDGEMSETICKVWDSYHLPRKRICSSSATWGCTGVIIGKGECKEFPSDGFNGRRGWLIYGWEFNGTGIWLRVMWLMVRLSWIYLRWEGISHASVSVPFGFPLASTPPCSAHTLQRQCLTICCTGIFWWCDSSDEAGAREEVITRVKMEAHNGN